ESQAIGCRKGGRLSIGKNVPLNRNSGVTPNRKIVANRSRLRCVAVKAMIGVANARPVSTADGTASTTRADLLAPNATITAPNTAPTSDSLKAIQATLP